MYFYNEYVSDSLPLKVTQGHESGTNSDQVKLVTRLKVVITWTVTRRARGSLIDDPSATMSLVMTSTGNSLSHISSVDSAFGHSLQKSATTENKQGD